MTPYQFNPDKHYLSSIVLEVDFFNKKNTTQDPFNSDEMAKEFSIQFCKQAFTVGMQCVFNFQDKKLLQVVVKVRYFRPVNLLDAICDRYIIKLSMSSHLIMVTTTAYIIWYLIVYCIINPNVLC